MIPQRNLSLLANRLAQGAKRRIPEAVLERDYCLAWFLVGLSSAPLRDVLAFKGGTALRRCYFPDYRFSEDLDFTLIAPTPFPEIRRLLEQVFAEVRRASGVGFTYSREDPHSHANSHTFYLTYQGPLPPTRAPKEVKVDVTIRECIVFDLEDRPVLAGYPEYSDLPADTSTRVATVRAYSLKEIAAEKVVALLDRARNEPRDLYDVWYLTSEGLIAIPDLADAIARKLEFRRRSLADVRGEFRLKERRYEVLWGTRLGGQMVDLPDFGEVYRAVGRALRQAELFE